MNSLYQTSSHEGKDIMLGNASGSDVSCLEVMDDPLEAMTATMRHEATAAAPQQDHDNATAVAATRITFATNLRRGREDDATLLTTTTTEYSKRPRRSSRQASFARIAAKKEKLEYSLRFKQAFKEATTLIAEARHTSGDGCCSGESVVCLAARLNEKYDLNGKRKLSRTTLYRALQQGMVGSSPFKKGPPPKIPSVLLDAVAFHFEVRQVGSDGKMRGKHFKILTGPAKLGTRFDKEFKTESIWQ